MELSVPIIVTAGSTYLDIDAYACCVGMRELLNLQGKRAIAYSKAPTNYSICNFLITPNQIVATFPSDCSPEEAEFIIADISDPDYIENFIPMDRIMAVYDHHVGFEQFWKERIGEAAHIDFIGAAATLIYREWKKAGLQNRMSRSSAQLLMAAILDNTLNFTSGNTTEEDRETYKELCIIADTEENWYDRYFSEVQKNVEADLLHAVQRDVKHISDNYVLPPYIAQLCVWNAESALKKLSEMQDSFNHQWGNWMMNVVDIQHQKSYFICNHPQYQKNIEKIFMVRFVGDVAYSLVPYLRKEIIKRAMESH